MHDVVKKLYRPKISRDSDLSLNIYSTVTVPKYGLRLQRVSSKFHVRFLK